MPLVAAFPSPTHVSTPFPGKLLALEFLSRGLLRGEPKPIHWPQPVGAFLLDLAGVGASPLDSLTRLDGGHESFAKET